jgi:hypothetical protein
MWTKMYFFKKTCKIVNNNRLFMKKSMINSYQGFKKFMRLLRSVILLIQILSAVPYIRNQLLENMRKAWKQLKNK